jgi:hypothetical protein
VDFLGGSERKTKKHGGRRKKKSFWGERTKNQELVLERRD